jgi:lycopene beta-cyclase
VQGSIALLDRRTTFGRDRTWCSWGVRPHVFSGLEQHSWAAWEVVTSRGASRHDGGRHPYVHLDSRDVYDHALARLGADASAEVVLGVAVLGADGRRVRTGAGEWEGGRVYDALALGSPLLPPAATGAVALEQQFLGWDVEVDRPLFDPGVATLMDFRLPQDGGLRFLYVLPFSRTRALVEDTSVSAAGPAPQARRAVLDAWLRERGARSWTVHHEERGAIPMTGRACSASNGPGVHVVGTGAGAVRPSSGYAFARIQRHCRAVADAVAAGREPPSRAGPSRLAAMDRIFLQALRDDPAAFPERFRAMVDGTSPDAFARFMDDAGTIADELRMVGALPKAPFLAAAGRTLRR